MITSPRKLGISKSETKCDCCNSTHTTYYVSFNDPNRPGDRVNSKNGSFYAPTRSGRACSPEHAIQVLTRLLEQEGEIIVRNNCSTEEESSRQAELDSQKEQGIPVTGREEGEEGA